MEIENKKIFWFWFFWTTGTIVILTLLFSFFFSFPWRPLRSLIGIILFSFLFLPSLLIALQFVFRKLRLIEKKRFIVAIILLATFFFIFYTAFAFHKHQNFYTGYDLAIFDQAVWHLSRFEVPESSIRNVPVIFGDHFDPILVFLAPFYWIFSDPRTLFVLQALILIFPVFILYLWGRKLKINKFYLLILSLFYLTSPAISSVAIFDFHEIIFAPLFLIGAFYFLTRRKWLYYFLCIILLIFTKETLGLLVGVIGLFVLFGKRLYSPKGDILNRVRYRVGLATLVLGIISFFLITGFIMPRLNYPFASYAYLEMYPGFENGVIKGAINYLKHPLQFLNLIFLTFPEKWWTLSLFLIPILIPLLFVAPAIFLFLPILAERVLSSYPYLSFVGTHYNLLFAPLMIIVFIYFLKTWNTYKFGQLLQKKISSKLKVSFPVLIITFPLVLSLVFSFRYSYILNPIEEWKSAKLPQREEFEDLLKTIPADVKTCASQIFLPHLSQRQDLYLVPRIKDAEFIVLQFCPSEQKICNNFPIRRKQVRGLYIYLKNHPAFEIKKETQNAVVFERVVPFNEDLNKELNEICALFIKNSYLEPVHLKYFLDNCYH